LFDASSLWPTVQRTPIVADRTIALVGAGISALGLTGWLWRGIRRGGWDRDAGYAAATVVMLLVSPITWDHYFLLLAQPAAVLWSRLPAGRPRFALAVALATLAVSLYQLVPVAMHLVGVEKDPTTGAFASPPYLTATILSVHTYALLTILVLLNWVRAPNRSVRASWRRHPPHDGEIASCDAATAHARAQDVDGLPDVG
jgi:hypothetical protein